MRDEQTTDQTLKIELLSQWKLEAEFRNTKKYAILSKVVLCDSCVGLILKLPQNLFREAEKSVKNTDFMNGRFPVSYDPSLITLKPSSCRKQLEASQVSS